MRIILYRTVQSLLLATGSGHMLLHTRHNTIEMRHTKTLFNAWQFNLFGFACAIESRDALNAQTGNGRFNKPNLNSTPVSICYAQLVCDNKFCFIFYFSI